MTPLKVILTALITIFTVVSVNSLRVVLNSSNEIALENQDGPNLVSFNFSLQAGTLLTKLNASNANGPIDASFLGVLPYMILEHNSTGGPVLSNAIYHSFLDFSLASDTWGGGLQLVAHDNDVYVIEGSWVPKDETRLRFQARMLVAARPTYFEGRTINPNQIVMIFTIITSVPFQLRNSILAFDQVLLAGTDELTNSTTPELFVFNSGNQTFLYINRTAYVDGREEPINDESIKAERSLSEPPPPDATSLNLLGLKVQDVLLNFPNSRGSQNITFEQRLAFGTASRAQNGSSSHIHHDSLSFSLLGVFFMTLIVMYII